jgi:hypothetical protein
MMRVSVKFASATAGKRYVLRVTLSAEAVTRTIDRTISVGPRSRAVTVLDRTATGVGVTVAGRGSVTRPLEILLSVMTQPAQWVTVRAETVCKVAGRRARSVLDRQSHAAEAGGLVARLRLPVASPDSCAVDVEATSLGAKRTELRVEVLATAT